MSSLLGIRQCYVGDERPNRNSRRLTFCLLGTATPSDLIRDTRSTPFNIGRRIELTDFTPQEAAPLASGLGENGTHLLARILYWTGGHPYLTQRMCQTVADTLQEGKQGSERPAPVLVDHVCAELFLSSTARATDDNLLFVRERLLRIEADLASLLDFYGRVRAGKKVANDETNSLVTLLKLSGIVKVEDRSLTVRNRIYAHVFNPTWVRENMPYAELWRQQAAFRRGLLRAVTVFSSIILAMAALSVYALFQKQSAEKNAESANTNALKADKAVARANKNAELAAANATERDIALREALAEKRLADTSAQAQHKAAERARKAAEGERKAAEGERKQKQEAFRQTGIAQKEAKRANHTQYIANMILIPREWENNNIGHILEFLKEIKSSEFRRSFEWGYWNRLCHLDLFTFQGHANYVTSAAFSPDGKCIVTASFDKTAKVWDAQTGQIIHTLKGHTSEVKSAAFSPNGKHIVTGSFDKTAKVWDAQTGQMILTLQGHDDKVTSASFSPDGKRIVTASGDRTAKVWDAQTGQDDSYLTGT